MMIMQEEVELEDSVVLIKCSECGEEKDILSFYKYKQSDERLPICKECVLEQLDIHDTNTFFWILQKLDVPFVREEWDKLIERYNNKSVLGRYLSKMKLKGWQPYCWEDTEKLEQWRLDREERAEESRIATQSPEAIKKRELIAELNSLICRSIFYGQEQDDKEAKDLLWNSIRNVAGLLDLNMTWDKDYTPLFSI